ncbi:arginine/serine-rich protein PNISR [Drosophila eugracilis]|uniref:arginine/serine-rich protein PNISR n=1 Tax=Drosophila eugracilis TaxID=29029 RepID=UPI001BD9DBAC|nr:arginine/serine-rich protein PNISR [Drosophila eugracilis]
MYPGRNGNADLGYNKHAHVHGQHGHGHNHNHNQFLVQPPPPPTHFSLPPGGGQGMMTPLVGGGLPLAMQGGAGIDWAQLAQQWIHMRDATPVTMSVAPPPPIIGNVPDYHHQTITIPVPSAVRTGFPLLEEHGEADMDMDDENERVQNADTPPPPAPVVTQSQWLAANEAPGATVDASTGSAVTLGKQQWNNWQTQSGKTTGNPTAHIPSLLKLNVSNPNEPQRQLQLQLQAQQQQPQHPTHPHHPQTHQQHPHQHHLTPHTHQPQQHQQQQESGSGSASTDIDANKRKMLPAWIREGLEKMEREKQRQLERQQPDEEVNHVKQVSSKTLTPPVNLLNIANVASDSEDSIDLPGEGRVELKEPQIGNELISKDGDNSSSEEDENEEEDHRGHIETGNRQTEQQRTATKNDVNGKTYEERLADLMLVVRRTLTEILLETTNEEIAAIAGETLKAHRAKASSAQVIRKSALSSITGNLGLAAYGDSSSESEEDEDDEDGERQADADKSVHLSAEELKARIRRSKRSFEKVIDDIEDRVAKQEQRDELALQRHRKRELERSEAGAVEHGQPPVNPELPGELLGQSTHDKPQQFNGKRPSRKERTTRFSDNKDGKQQSQSYVQQVVAAAAVAPISTLSSGPHKLKPVPNPATNLLQMPESVATMLSAADKALHKANKSTHKSKSKRRHSSTSSSSSSSSGSSSSTDSDDSSTSSGASKTSSIRGKRVRRHGHRSQGSSRSKYERRDRERERERDRDRDRSHRQHRSHVSGGSSSGGHRQKHSGEDRGGSSSSYHRSSRQSSSRTHDHGNSSSSRKRHRTRSRSKSRSTHHSSSNAYSSSSSASHPRKRH